MTIPQIEGFMDAIQRKASMNNAVQVSNIAIGTHGDSKTIKKTIEGYTSTSKSKVKSRPRTLQERIEEEELFLS